MKLQNLTIIFIIIILPIVLVLSAYIGYEVKTINKQNMYNTGLNTAVHDAIFAYEMNSKNDVYSNNAENKRSNIKASVKTFENSLSNACNLGLYNNDAIEEYIPAVVFGMYDGFYMYAPSENAEGEYKHNLRNYVYYSEQLPDTDIIIRYTLDNYVAVSGTINGTYVTKSGYLINLNDLNGSNIKDKIADTTIRYKGISINTETISEYNYNENEKIIKESKLLGNESAKAYYKKAYEFTKWFIEEAKISDKADYLKIDASNDPEDENSSFVQNKNKIIKTKMENVLNSSITAYANKTRNSYKLPKFNEEEWEKIYSNISIVALVQGMNLGFKTYNNYCIVSSTNNSEYVNPNLLYFTDGNSYHDIRCNEIKGKETTGYKIGDFEKIKYEITDEEGKVTDTNYYYKHNELACYQCINGNQSETTDIYTYVRSDSADSNVKKSYFTALARERERTVKLLEKSFNSEHMDTYTVKYNIGTDGETNGITPPASQTANIGATITIQALSEADINKMRNQGFEFKGWIASGSTLQSGDIYIGYSDITLTANWEKVTYKVTFDSNGGTNPTSQTKECNKGEYNISDMGIEEPSRTGYTFKGWSLSKNGDTVEEINVTADTTLYALWIRKTAELVYMLDGNQVGDSIKGLKVGNTYKPSITILNNQEGYENKILLGYTYDGGKVNYDGYITIPDKSIVKLNTVYVENSLKMDKPTTKPGKTMKNPSEDGKSWYTNTDGIIRATVRAENNEGNPKIDSNITGDNNFQKSGDTYVISSNVEGTNTIKASLTLSKDGVSRKMKEETFTITVDRTAPVINGFFGYEYTYFMRGSGGHKTYVDHYTEYINVTEENLGTVSTDTGGKGYFFYNYTFRGKHSNVVVTYFYEENVKSKHTITAFDKAGNSSSVTVTY